ncbi:MAG: HlyD family efflux transporter periplasmic adaptor subunit [Candidatus Paceibacterota bacterium]|jgi:multidrug efflux pump subunit AcrA (membrane-fusion protein)
MKEKIKNFAQYIKSKPAYIVVVVVTILVIISSAVYAFSSVKSDDISNTTNNNFTGNNDISIAVAGEENSLINGNAQSNNSWPGEIISLNNLQVQPDREGTVSEWYVHIGEQVKKGQVLGRLSRPPQTPDAIMSLSEKTQMLGEARTSVEALRTYTTKRIAQLQQLSIDTENSNKEKIDLLKSDTLQNDSLALSLIASKKKMAQVILRGSISKVFPIITYQTIVPTSILNYYNIQLKWPFGVTDSSLRNKFPSVLFGVLSDLEDQNIVPEKYGLLYFETLIKLANASITDGESLSNTDIESLKQMLIEDQAQFVSVLGEIKSMEIEKADVQRDSIDKLDEINAMIAELEKELAMSEGDLKAKELAYSTVNNSISGGYSIVAPKSGVVSSIDKKPGEFVGPGMPVATVTAGDSDSILVRIRIPNNIKKPKVGELLSIVRPGFGTDIQRVRLVGIGSSLDRDGSYMADAVFTELTKWSIGSSVRVLAPVDSPSVLIKYSSVIWGEEGVPTVWAVSEAGRIFTKKITIGRTLGSLVEIYTGLKNGDRYIVNPTPEIKENALLDEIIKNENSADDGSGSNEKDTMGGMSM